MRAPRPTPRPAPAPRPTTRSNGRVGRHKRGKISEKNKTERRETRIMPQVLEDQLSDLERWTQANKRDAQRDTIRFWCLKIPAILVSAASGIFAHFEWQTFAVIGGAVASACVLIDGLNPGGMLRNIHLRAVHDLRSLQNEVVAAWQIGSLEKKRTKSLTAKIIKDAQKETRRIGVYIRDAETMLGAKKS